MSNQNNKKTLMINLIAPPSRGKTSISYKLAADLKLKYQEDVELVSEFAKEKCFMGINLFEQNEKEKYKEMKEQIRREKVFYNKVKFLVTSSPISMVAFYLQNQKYIDIMKNHTQGKDEINFYLTLDSSYAYEQNGRELWSEDAVKKLDSQIIDFHNRIGKPLIMINGTAEDRVNQIIHHIKLKKARDQFQVLAKA